MPEIRRSEEIVKFVFSTAPGYRVVSANAAWGGLTPRGDLKVDFAIDSLRTPDVVVNSVTPGGGLGPEIERQPAERLVSRELQVGVILSIANAESIANWLLEKVREAKEKVR